MAVIIQLRRGLEITWSTINPILEEGEMGVELDTGRFKVGNGITAWKDLAYSSGDDGATWLNGEGEPSLELGKNGDYYLETVSSDVYVKADDSWSQISNIKGPAGEQGIQGEAGASWHNGEGVPGSELGEDGDYYLDSLTGKVYLKDETWTITADIKGVQGEPGIQGLPGQDGSTWHNGEGVPDGELGEDGDYYLNTLTSDVYKKDGTWSIVANIKGEPGEKGEQGEQGEEGPPGTVAGNLDGGLPYTVYTSLIINGGVEE